MKVSSAVVLASLASIVSAGLEDAKYSTVLTADNFASTIGAQENGTLVAFFAPWCGYCKKLEPVWTDAASAFVNDERCKIAHFNADQEEHRDIAQQYGIKSYPTIKFVPSNGSPATDYQDERSVEKVIEFMNRRCGTDKVVGGGLRPRSGIINSLDRSLATFFLSDDASERKASMDSLRQVVKELTPRPGYLPSYYEVVVNKFQNAGDETLAKGKQWLEKELTRLNKIVSKQGNLPAKKRDEFSMKINILTSLDEHIKSGKKPEAQDIQKTAANVNIPKRQKVAGEL